MPIQLLSDDPMVAASGLAEQDLPAGALYVVATPIGNAADITLRALWVLAHADAIACEDTRTTRPLLDRYGISAKLLSAHQHNERAMADALAERLRRGERVALVTDAGTPAVSDPGARLVAALREADHRIVPVPGASSVTAALSVSGLAEGPWTFIGFLPTGAKERARLLRETAAGLPAAVILEAPHRIAATARSIAAIFEPARRVVVARELTKKFETITATTAAELPQAIDASPARGEFVLLIEGRTGQRPEAAEIDAATRRWLDALSGELPASKLAGLAARATGLPRAALYDAIIAQPGTTDRG